MLLVADKTELCSHLGSSLSGATLPCMYRKQHDTIRPLEVFSEQGESEENPMPMNNEEVGDWPAPTEAKAKRSFSTGL